MTEDEARKRWCPFTRLSFADAPTAVCNRISVDMLDTNKAVPVGFCIASECMAWRGEPIMTTNDDGKIVCRTDGYCGLAGKP